MILILKIVKELFFVITQDMIDDPEPKIREEFNLGVPRGQKWNDRSWSQSLTKNLKTEIEKLIGEAVVFDVP